MQRAVAKKNDACVRHYVMFSVSLPSLKHAFRMSFSRVLHHVAACTVSQWSSTPFQVCLGHNVPCPSLHSHWLNIYNIRKHRMNPYFRPSSRILFTRDNIVVSFRFVPYWILKHATRCFVALRASIASHIVVSYHHSFRQFIHLSLLWNPQYHCFLREQYYCENRSVVKLRACSRHVRPCRRTVSYPH